MWLCWSDVRKAGADEDEEREQVASAVLSSLRGLTALQMVATLQVRACHAISVPLTLPWQALAFSAHFEPHVTVLEAAPLDLRWVRVVHDSGHVARVQEAPDAFATTLKAAGAACAAVDCVMQPGAHQRRALCAVEPLGRDAGRDGGASAAFNVAAVAAKYALLRHDIARVAVVDVGGAGRGVIDLLGGDDDILCVSLGNGAAAVAANVVTVALEGNHGWNADVCDAAAGPIRAFRPQLLVLCAEFAGAHAPTACDYFALTAALLAAAVADDGPARVVSLFAGPSGVAEAHALALVAPEHALAGLARSAREQRWSAVQLGARVAETLSWSTADGKRERGADADDEAVADKRARVDDRDEAAQEGSGAGDVGAPTDNTLVAEAPDVSDPVVMQEEDSDSDSQEGTAREGADVQLDYELSERSYTEAVDRPALAPMRPPTRDPPPPAAAPAAPPLDLDEINALLGDDL